MKSFEQLEALLGIEEYHLIVRIAMLGCELGDADATIRIADGLLHARPDLPDAYAVRAMGYVKLDRCGEAARELETVLERSPDFQIGWALLGMCMKFGGQKGWQIHCESVINDGSDELAVILACGLLKRTPGPAVGGVGNVTGPDTDGNSGSYPVWA